MTLAKRDSPITLLKGDDPPPVCVTRADGTSPFVFTCEHAGNRIPHHLNGLRLNVADLGRHIAWDIGAAAVARGLAERFDAALVTQTYSRLVIDCNRSPRETTSIATVSDGSAIPGNVDIGPHERAARESEIFHPYHDCIASLLDARQEAGRPALLVPIHSFTPVFGGFSRPWQIGFAYNRYRLFTAILIEILVRGGDLCIGDNEPYSVSATTDYTLPVHGEKRAIPHAQIELRQDLIAAEAGQSVWIEQLGDALSEGLSALADKKGI